MAIRLRLIEGDRLIILKGIKNGVERRVEVSWFRVGRGLIQLKRVVWNSFVGRNNTDNAWHGICLECKLETRGDTRIRNKYHAIDSFDANREIDQVHLIREIFPINLLELFRVRHRNDN